MYRGFILNVEWNDIEWVTDEYCQIGLKIFSEHRRAVRVGLDPFLLNDGAIDGAKMEAEWFPQIEADVFISHAHADFRQAVCFARYLRKEFKLTVFVDSCVWRNGDELLKIIDRTASWDAERGFYVYEKRNFTTSHVHMMLASSLLKLIDKTECFFFIKALNSSSATVRKTVTETESPWIYGELLMSSMIRRNIPLRHALGQLSKSFSDEPLLEKAETIRHKADTGHLLEVDNFKLTVWLIKAYGSDTGLEALDELYTL
ncbi:MAG: hypothetical protein JST68_04420 [Bacteroidetes bacterium]|nr:hypothetical protein [Bacteroidota bacterium]